MMFDKILVALASCLLLPAGSGCKAESTHGTEVAINAPAAFIGTATQEADGTIVLQLRTSSDGGIVGDALVRYPRDNPDYAAVARHVGPIPKGGSVFVKPFADP